MQLDSQGRESNELEGSEAEELDLDSDSNELDPMLPVLSRGKDDSEDSLSFWRRITGAIELPWKEDHYMKRPICLLFVILIVLGMILGILLVVVLPGTQSSSSHRDVDLGYSKYRGLSKSNNITQWLGMRYAAPPLGDLRFRAPRDPLNTTKLQIATTNGPSCLSTGATTITKGFSEDCLFINVFAPTSKSNLLPVYIFIRGGGFNSLANQGYDGSSLIKASGHEIVVVTFNYRVGPYGFLTSKEVEEDGDLNNGLKDQRKVFRWVQTHISKFGGDPGTVTIGGDSAGGASVDLHLSAYGGRDDGLFHAAAAESQSFGPSLNVSESQYQYDGLVSRTGCSNAIDTLRCLRDLDVSVLQAQNTKMPYPGQKGAPLFMYSTVVDGDLVPDTTYRLFAQGKFLKIPVIFGDTTNEGTIFAPKSTANYSQMNTFLQNNFPNLTTDQLSNIDTLYPKAQQFPNSGAYWRTAANAYGEMRYNCPGIFLSSVFDKANVSGNWNYHYDVTDPTASAQGYGVSHTVEVTALWGGPPYVPSGTPPSYQTTNKQIIPIMQGYWTSFIRAHNPNTFRYPGTPEWERFSVAEKERILFRGNGTEMDRVDGGQGVRCEYLSGIASLIQQ